MTFIDNIQIVFLVQYYIQFWDTFHFMHMTFTSLCDRQENKYLMYELFETWTVVCCGHVAVITVLLCLRSEWAG